MYKEEKIPGPGQYKYELSTNDGPKVLFEWLKIVLS